MQLLTTANLTLWEPSGTSAGAATSSRTTGATVFAEGPEVPPSWLSGLKSKLTMVNEPSSATNGGTVVSGAAAEPAASVTKGTIQGQCHHTQSHTAYVCYLS